jgi:hypothetical protein
MRVPIVITSALFSSLAAVPSRAQYLAPVAARPLAVVSTVRPGSDNAPSRDTLAGVRREISPVGTIIGGVMGGVAGAVVGVAIASRTTMNCHGEFCGFGEALLGFGLGESIGLAVGAHVGSRSPRHENIFLTSLSSVGILVGGVLGAVALDHAGGAGIMIPVTPALQLAAALAIELQ